MNRAVLIDPDNRPRASERGGRTPWQRSSRNAPSSCSAPKCRSRRSGRCTAGALSAMFDNGALRYIKLGEIEVLRAIAFLVRDENWGTFTPAISNLKIKQGKTVSASATTRAAGDAKQALAYRRRDLRRRRWRRCRSRPIAMPESDFLTNRTGFVVLHPLTGVAGYPGRGRACRRRKVKDKFPALVNPIQPFFDIRSLTPQGDAAASSRPAAWKATPSRWRITATGPMPPSRPMCGRWRMPWPYTLRKRRSSSSSRSRLTFSGKLPRPKAAARAKPIEITLGRAGGAHAGDRRRRAGRRGRHAARQRRLIEQAAPRHLICEVGRTPAADWPARSASISAWPRRPAPT